MAKCRFWLRKVGNRAEIGIKIWLISYDLNRLIWSDPGSTLDPVDPPGSKFIQLVRQRGKEPVQTERSGICIRVDLPG